MFMQHLIFWFFNKYGFYFYIEKFKLMGNKILLQLYYYKTYLYYHKSYKNKVERVEGFVNLAYNKVIPKWDKYNKFKLFALLSRTNTRKKGRAFWQAKSSKCFRIPLITRTIRMLLQKFFPPLFNNTSGNLSITSDTLLSYKINNILNKLHYYLKFNFLLSSSSIFVNINYLKFLLTQQHTNKYIAQLYNHLYIYLFFVAGKYKLPKIAILRNSLLRKISILKKNAQARKLIKMQEAFDKKNHGRLNNLAEFNNNISQSIVKLPVVTEKKQWYNKNKRYANYGARPRSTHLTKSTFRQRYSPTKYTKMSPQMLIKYKQLQSIKKSFTFNFFFTYYFAFFFQCQTHLIYKSLYKYMFNHNTLRQEYNVLCQRSKYLRRRNIWAFDFLFFIHYSVTFGNTLFLWPFLVYHLKRTFKRHGATMQLIINVIRTIFFLKPYFKGFKIMIKGPFDRHGRSRKLLLHLGHMGFTKYMQHPIMYDMIHCPIVYGMCSIKFWMAYE